MPVRYKDISSVELGRRGSRVFYKKTRRGIGGADEEAGMDVSIVFEMVSRPQQSNDGTSVAFNSSLLLLNPDWFTGSLVFSLEAQVSNKSLVNDYVVTVQNAATLAVIKTLTVPANTAPGAQESVWMAAATPLVLPAGDVQFQMTLPVTAEDNALQVFRLRVRVVGRMITGMFQIPMEGIGGGINEQDLVFGDSRFTFGDTGYIAESASAFFFKQAGAWATIDRWRWESVSGNTGFLGVPLNYIALVPAGTLDVIVQNIHTTAASVTGLVSTDFADNAAFFVDGGTFEIASREDAGGGASNSVFLKANLYVHVTALSKASAYYVVNAATRMPIAAADFSDIAGAGHEITATETVAGTLARVITTSVSASTAGAEVTLAGTAVDPDMLGVKARYRVTGFADPAGSVFYNSGSNGGTGSITVNWDYLILFLEK